MTDTAAQVTANLSEEEVDALPSDMLAESEVK